MYPLWPHWEENQTRRPSDSQVLLGIDVKLSVKQRLRVCRIKHSWSRCSFACKLAHGCLSSVCPAGCSDKLSELWESSPRGQAPPLAAASLSPQGHGLSGLTTPRGGALSRVFLLLSRRLQSEGKCRKKFQAASVSLLLQQEMEN